MLEKFKTFFAPNPFEVPARALYHRIVEQARQPFFYQEFSVPDTNNGRFDMIVLHCYCIMRRLKNTPNGFDLSQMLATVLIEDLDRNLREMGVGDLSVGKKVKRIAEGFYGRLDAYDAALLDGGTEIIADALKRNVYYDVEMNLDEGVTGLANYFQMQIKNIDQASFDGLSNGIVNFLSPNYGE